MNDGTDDLTTPAPAPGQAGADTTPTLPLPAATPPWAPWSTGGAAAPPPPPPPPPSGPFAGWTPMWMPESAPPPRPRNRRTAAAVLVGIFAIGIGAGVGAERLTSSRASTPGSTALLPTVPGQGSGDTGTGGSGASGSGSSGTAPDTSGVAAKVTPGIVNVNVTMDGGGAAAGTGMVITSTGEVLTNNHVIDGESSVSVELPSNGKTYTAHVLGWSPTDDVALIQIDGGSTSFTTVSIGDSSSVTVGEAVVALGNALGKNGAPSVTSGNVTALNRTITASDQGGGNAETVSGLIQVDAQIQPGDSGGPLTTSDGSVIGMDTAAQSGSGRFGGAAGSTAAFAIPINHAIAVVKQIQSGQATTAVHIGATRALLGVGAQDSATGVQVQTVQSGSGAATAGITVGSIITALDGKAVSTNSALRAAILAHKPGDRVSVSWTDPAGATHNATVTLSSGPPA